MFKIIVKVDEEMCLIGCGQCTDCTHGGLIKAQRLFIYQIDYLLPCY